MQRRKFLRTAGVGGCAVAAADVRLPRRPSRNRCRNSNGAWRRASPSRSTRCTARARSSPSTIGEMTDNKFQIRVFAAGEIVPGLQVLDAVQNGTVEMGHTAGYYYVGKDPTFAFDTARAVRHSTRASRRRGSSGGGGRELLSEFYKDYNVYHLPCGNTGAQMGGWFRKEIKTRRRPQGPEVPHRRHRRPGDAASWARCRSRSPAATSIRRWRRARSTPPNGSVPYDDQKLGFNKIAPYYYYPGWWEGGPQTTAYDRPRQVERAAQDLQGRRRGGIRLRADVDACRSTMPRIPRRCASWWPAAPSCMPFPQPVMEAAFKRLERALRRDLGQEPQVQEDLRQLAAVPQRGDPVVPRLPRTRSTTSWPACRRPTSSEA